jgi:bifunctional DNA-binding transcriptional regulator/antitoxin component of YhaV-PrlF toxin-antitoxin module
MAKQFKFKATIQAAGGGGAYVLFPYDAKESFGTSGRVPITATFNGEPYSGTMVKYGHPQHMLVVLKEIREKIGKQVGDEITVTVTEDKQERSIETPAELEKLLKKHKLKEVYEKFSLTHKKEWIKAIADAKRPETKEKRLQLVIDTLMAKLAKK